MSLNAKMNNWTPKLLHRPPMIIRVSMSSPVLRRYPAAAGDGDRLGFAMLFLAHNPAHRSTRFEKRA
jgi:hypothetical protein